VNREVVDRLLWRRSQIGEGGAQSRQGSRIAELHQANENVVVHADVLLVQPVNGGQKEAGYLVQNLNAAVSRSTFDNSIQLGNQIDKGNIGHPRRQFLFRSGPQRPGAISRLID
jgi:hypothetical protein